MHKIDGRYRTISAADFADAVRRLSQALDRLGIERGDRVLIVLQNRAECAVLHWATQLAGIIATPVNWRANAAEVDFFVTDAEARAPAPWSPPS